MVEYFTKKPYYHVTVITKIRRRNKNTSIEKIMRDSGADVLRIMDAIDYPSSRDKILDAIKPESVVFFNSPLPHRLLGDLRSSGLPSSIFVRSGGNDIGLPWITFVEGSPFSLAYRMLMLRVNGSCMAAHIRKERVNAINSYADFLITNSEFSNTRSIELGVKPNKIVCITGGVHIERFQPRYHSDRRELRILTVGRLVRFKGVDFALKAFAYCRERSSIDLKMTIVGSGPEERCLKKLAEDLGVGSSVTFEGTVPYEKVQKYYEQSDILLHMPILKFGARKNGFAHTETMGRVLCEACAAGIPIVSSSVGGIPEIVLTGKNGFLVKERDFAAAGEKLLILHNLKLRQDMGARGRKFAVQRLGWDRVFARYDELFQRGNGTQEAINLAQSHEIRHVQSESDYRTPAGESRIATAISKLSWRIWWTMRGSGLFR
jgi:glycosyltransferase involved in cell wall biosynthesis